MRGLVGQVRVAAAGSSLGEVNSLVRCTSDGLASVSVDHVAIVTDGQRRRCRIIEGVTFMSSGSQRSC